MAQGPEAGRPRAEAQQKVNVGSSLRSGKLCVMLAEQAGTCQQPISHRSGNGTWAGGTEGSREVTVMAARDTCDSGDASPSLVPLQLRFAVEEAAAQEGQATCLQAHSLALNFQSSENDPMALLVFTTTCWHLASLSSEQPWERKQCHHFHFSGEQQAQKRQACSRFIAGRWAARLPNVCLQPHLRASSPPSFPGSAPITCQQPPPV